MSIGSPRNAREANYLALAATPEEIVERVLLLMAQQQQSVNVSLASGTLPVANGGTSVGTLTSHGVLVGEGTSAVVGVTGSTGQVLHAITGADPAFSAVSLTADVSGTLPIANGGTNLSSYTTGDLIYASAATVLSKLPGVATGNALISGGVGSAPSWGKVGLTTHITGTLAEGNGGTNQSTYTLGDILYSSASNTLSKLAGNTIGTKKFLRQTGTGAVSAAPAWDTIVAADVPGSALTKTDDTNVTMTLGGSPTTALLNAASITLGWSGQLGLTRGGTAASLTASNGGIVYSTASAFAILSGTATAGQVLRSGASTTPAWSTATYPATAGTAANVLRSDGTNFLSAALAAADLSNGVTGSGNVVLQGTPTLTTPVLGVASATSINFGGTALSVYSESTWTPTVTAGSGTFTTVSATGSYTKIGNVCYFRVAVTITTNGTAAGTVEITLPFTPSVAFQGVGRETGVTGNRLFIYHAGGAGTASIVNLSDASYPGSNGYVLRVNGFFFV